MTWKNTKKWLSDHKEEIITGACGVTLFAVAIYFHINGSNNKIDATGKESLINPLTNPNCTNLEEVTYFSKGTPKCPHDVTSHIRNLGAGRHASIEKIESASIYGFVLEKNQTWVAPYSTGKHLH